MDGPFVDVLSEAILENSCVVFEKEVSQDGFMTSACKPASLRCAVHIQVLVMSCRALSIFGISADVLESCLSPIALPASNTSGQFCSEPTIDYFWHTTPLASFDLCILSPSVDDSLRIFFLLPTTRPQPKHPHKPLLAYILFSFPPHLNFDFSFLSFTPCSSLCCTLLSLRYSSSVVRTIIIP